MALDPEKLREALRQECYGSAVIRGNAMALSDLYDVEDASTRRLLELAKRFRLDPRKFQKDEDEDEES